MMWRYLAGILAAYFLFVPVPSAEAQTGSWESLAPMPAVRDELGTAILNGSIYEIGKFPVAGQTVTPVQRYDPEADSWETVAPVPTAVALNHIGVAAAGGLLYAIGGWKDGTTAVDTVFSYDPATNEWTERANLPAPRAAMGVATIGNWIFAAGGLPVSNNTHFTAYNTTTDSWITLPDMPTGRDHLAAVALRGKFYAFSGRELGVRLTAVESFNPATGMWSAHAPIPTPRGGIAATVVAERAYVFGGEGNPEPGSNGAFREVEEYDPVSDSWRAMADLPDEGRHGIGAAAHRGRIHIAGGSVTLGFAPTDRHDAFTPPGQTLVTFDGTPFFDDLTGVFDGIDWGAVGWLSIAGNFGPCIGPRALSPQSPGLYRFVDPAAMIAFDVGSIGGGGFLAVLALDEVGNFLEFATASLPPSACVTVDTGFTRRAAEIRIFHSAGAFAIDNILYAAP